MLSLFVRIRTYNQKSLLLMNRHLNLMGLGGGENTDDTDSGSSSPSSSSSEPSSPVRGLRKDARVVVISEDHVFRKQPSMRGQIGVLMVSGCRVPLAKRRVEGPEIDKHSVHSCLG